MNNEPLNGDGYGETVTFSYKGSQTAKIQDGVHTISQFVDDSLER